MARILIDGVWYDEVSTASLYETNFQDILLSRADLLYPGYHAVRFTPIVYSDTDSARPDFALVDRKYRDWWIVEVETGNHSLESHVLPQVRTLSQATYGKSEADYLCSKSPALDKHAVVDLMKGSQPRVLVVVNTPKPDWAQALAPYSARVAVVEVFRSESNRYVFRINGEHPQLATDAMSRCAPDPLIPRLLAVESPAALGIPTRSRVRIWYNGQVSEWSRIDAEDKVWLNPVSSNPLSPGAVYHLMKLDDGSLELRRIDGGQGRKA